MEAKTQDARKLDEFETAEEWLLRPENDWGQANAHGSCHSSIECGKGVINPQCELCRLSIILPAYAKFRNAPDTAKEQAGRKMFEALEEMIEACAGCFRVIAVGGLAEKLNAEYESIGVKESFGTRAKAALAAGREAGWGQ